MNILFIGNSYTFYSKMPDLFEGLANSNGKGVRVCSITKGGRKLKQFADPSDPVTEALDTLLTQETFSVCFLQEQSVLPAVDFDSFADGLDCVVSKISGKTAGIILYATWGRKAGSEILTEHRWTTESMTHILSQAYEKAAALYGALVSPVGNNFLYITQNYPEIDLYDKDLSHPSYLGSCLAALTHYYTVFHEFPAHTDPLSLSDPVLSAFHSAVCRSATDLSKDV